VDLPTENGDFHSYVNVYQRVTQVRFFSTLHDSSPESLQERISDRCRSARFYVIFHSSQRDQNLVLQFPFWNLAPFSVQISKKFRDFQFWPLPTVLHIDFLRTALGHEVPHLYQSAAFEWQPRTFNTVASGSPPKNKSNQPMISSKRSTSIE